LKIKVNDLEINLQRRGRLRSGGEGGRESREKEGLTQVLQTRKQLNKMEFLK